MRPMSQTYRNPDEIDLVDLYLGLRRHWLSMLITFLVLAIVAMILIRQVPRKYQYSAVLSIGGTLNDSGFHAFESPETALTALQNIYLPAASRAASLAKSDAPKITASTPKDSHVILLQAKGTLEQGPVISNIMKSSFDRVISREADVLNDLKSSIRSGYKLRIGSIEERIAGLKKSAAAKGLRKSDQALILDNIQQLQQQKTDLQQQLAQALSGLQPAVLVDNPQRSLKPVGIGMAAMLLLGLVLSAMGACFIGLIGMFRDAVQERTLAHDLGTTETDESGFDEVPASTRTEPSFVRIASHRH